MLKLNQKVKIKSTDQIGNVTDIRCINDVIKYRVCGWYYSEMELDVLSKFDELVWRFFSRTSGSNKAIFWGVIIYFSFIFLAILWQTMVR